MEMEGGLLHPPTSVHLHRPEVFGCWWHMELPRVLLHPQT